MKCISKVLLMIMMIVSSCLLPVSAEESMFTIGAGFSIGGTVETDKSEAALGETVTVSYEASEHYELVSVFVDGQKIEGLSFEVTGNHIVTGLFERIQYEMTVEDTEGGTLTLSKMTGGYGDLITVSADVDEGYELVNLYLDGEVLDVPVFTVKGEHTVSAEFDKMSDPIAVRLSGPTRYETSLLISSILKNTLGLEKFETVIIASGRHFADALAGSYLAVKKNAPILLVDPVNNNMDQIKEHLLKHMNSEGTVFILGGEVAIPSWAEEALSEYHVVRLSGKTRYETNIKILEEAGVEDEEILVCSSENFADSLSASSLGRPILLVGDELKDVQKEYLSSLSGNTFYVMGGAGVVSLSVENELSDYNSDVQRIGGVTRYDTSVRIANHFYESDTVVLTYARNYPDGLCGGPLAYVLGAPLLLVDTDMNDLSDDIAVMYAHTHDVYRAVVLGGSGLVKDQTVKDMLDMDEDDLIQVINQEPEIIH